MSNTPADLTHPEQNCNKQNDDGSFSFVQAEHEVLAFWQQHGIFEQSLLQTKGNPEYVFYDGPPFATGLPHHGHLAASTIKDVIPRYQTMKGHYVERRFGWDCHGLPIEHEIDKAFGMSAQEAVAKFGLARYNDECRAIVQRYSQQWRKTITRLGRWVDFDNDYRTLEPWYMESVWWVFQQLWQQDMVYLGQKVVPYSTELATVLSNFEASSNYKDVQDPAVTVLFELVKEDAYIAAWTTTPWTLPANLALCLHPEFEYVKVQVTGFDKPIWLAKEQIKSVFAKQDCEVLARALGKQMAGKAYHALFPYFASDAPQATFTLLADEFVQLNSGTGVVHLAPAFGEDDQRVCLQHDIALSPCPIDEQGRFTHEVADYAGQYVKQADKCIIRDLKLRGLVLRHETISHSYPFCPRSDTPIIYRTVPSWYIKVSEMRDELVANNEEVNWVPGHMQQGRMGNWLANAHDWAVSRNRYWGTPLPIWHNDITGKYYCVGSLGELQTLTGETVTDLHRDHIDDLCFSLNQEQGVYRRVQEVFDCWFESGAMPYAQQHYPFANKSNFEQRFPADFIAEGVDQTRGWFYTLQVISQCLFKQPAFKNVIVNGTVMADDGKKMSKRLKNYTPPDSLMEQYGADALRLYLLNSGLVKAEEQRFSDSGVQEMVRQVLLPWHNCVKFFQTYADIDQWQKPAPCDPTSASNNVLDLWIVSKLESLKQQVDQAMQQYRLDQVVMPLFEYLEDLTNWYIRLNRGRYWAKSMSKDKQNAYRTLHYCLSEFATLMAPFTPFMAEYTFQALSQYQKEERPKSVHLCQYPAANAAYLDQDLESSVKRFQDLVTMGRQNRNDLKINLKTPLSLATVLHTDEAVLNDVKRLEDYIRAELNVKKLHFSTAENDYIQLQCKANFSRLGKRLGKQMKRFASLLAELSGAKISELQQIGSLTLAGETFTLADVMIVRQAKTGVNAVSNGHIALALSPQLTPELLAEGMVRELTSQLQKLRKASGFAITDAIVITLRAESETQQAIQALQDYLMTETLAQALSFDLTAGSGTVLTLSQSTVEVLLEKAQ
ncbi:isoleucine--tRNA ligase [Motilimonas pumila]|uniref:Isoleucine--tRNA ligase n=1 Tax=Motilimonas pumila TaxID=2303987 RepID=A0A418YAR5_9GAMM|nr:isoleucine--tRNA ligase [Motilimonas pumila]RJG40050.1 isoleucine--tRNA ligase [Motilimonas pumila]